MTNHITIIMCAAVLFAGAAQAQSLYTPLSGGGNYSPMDWMPEELRSSHSAHQDGHLEVDGEIEISLTPKEGEAVYTMRFLSGPAAAAASEMLEFAEGVASEMGEAATAEVLDLDFPDGVPCFGSREDIQIICALDNLALEFGGENVEYDTLRGLADQMAPLQAIAAAN